jgi:thiamine-phosphate pyrophosphorylase
MASDRKSIAGLYVLTEATAEGSQALLRRVELVLRGGAMIVQYRDKSADHERRRYEASEIGALCRRYRAMFIVNDDVALAAEAAADGVHLGRDDADPREARASLGTGSIIGVSCYDSLQRAEQAAAVGADYVAFGSFYPSPTKPNAVRAPLGLLAEAKRRLSLPVVAIGGITPDNAGGLIEAGADAVAVISSVFLADDPHAQARRLADLFSHPPR